MWTQIAPRRLVAGHDGSKSHPCCSPSRPPRAGAGFSAPLRRRTDPITPPLSVIARVGEIDTSQFETEVLQADTPVLVDFWAVWCGPCKLMAPLMDWVEKEFQGALKVVKVNVDPNPELVEKYKVYGLPTVMLFQDGKEVEGSKREGAVTKQQLMEWLASNGMTVPAKQ